MAKKDYYSILGIDRNATADEIKKAYRKKAMQHHPDRNPNDKDAADKFKEIAEAYDVLGDPKKRKQYDRTGHSGIGGGKSSNTSSNSGSIIDPIFGEFYTITPKGKLVIDDAQLIDFIEKCGWRWITIGGGKRLVRIRKNIVENSDTGEIVRYIRQWVMNVLPRDLGNDVTKNELLSKIVGRSRNLFEKVRFEFIKQEEVRFVEDTKDTAYFFFGNGAAQVTKEDITMIPYESLNGLVWRHAISNKTVTLVQVKPLESEIEQFLFNVSGRDKSRYQSLITLIAYIIHSYKDPANAFAIILVDQEIGETGDANGGTGKGLISNIFKFVRSTIIVPMKNFSIKRTFAFQRVQPGTKVVVLQDVNSKEDFENYYNLITDDWTTEQKHKGEICIPFEEAPKVLFTGNDVMKGPSGNSSDRREVTFEVSDYYGPNHTPKDDFGHNLFNDWDDAEWNLFHNIIMKFMKIYLTFGVKRPPQINIASRKIMKTIGPEFYEYMEDKLLEGTVRFHKKEIHDEFIKAYPDLRVFFRSPNKTTKKIKQFLAFKGIPFYEHPAATKKFIIITPNKEVVPPSTVPPAGEPSVNAPAETSQVKTIKDVAHQYHIVNTADKRKNLIAELERQTCFAFDTETTGLEYATLEIRGLAIAFKPNEAYYVPLPKNKEQAKKVLAEFAHLFTNPLIEKIAHNYKYDQQVLKKYGIAVSGKIFDTMLAHYLCNPDSKKHGLKLVTLEMLNYQQIEYNDLFDKDAKSRSIDKVPLNKLAEYSAEDVDFTLQLKPLLEKDLCEKDLLELFTNIEVPLATVLGDMEEEGIKVDAQALRELNMEAQAEMKTLEEQVYELAGETFNINSPRQLSKILFQKLGLESQGEKNASGDYSTAATEIDKLKDAHPIIPIIIKYNKISSLSSTFMEKLPNQVNPFTGRVHTNFNQAVTSTGRLSSSSPSVQNIPKQAHGFGQHIRKAFVGRDDNHVIVAADYSQIELRIAAHFSGDTTLIQAYLRDDDIHTLTAAKVFGVPISEITKDDNRRKVAKSVSFGILYGMGTYTLAQRLTRETGKLVTELEAKEIIESYFTTYPGIKQFSDDAIFNAVSKGYAETLMKRKRFLPDINSYDSAKRSAAKRNAVNTPIQGSSADIIKIAMVNIHKELAERKLNTRMVLQVHDELLFDVPKDELDEVLVLVKDKMENAVTLKVPLTVDIKYGKNWFEAH
ncbi:MAG: DNA polymerase I [Bacteroidia bacterium]